MPVGLHCGGLTVSRSSGIVLAELSRFSVLCSLGSLSLPSCPRPQGNQPQQQSEPFLGKTCLEFLLFTTLPHPSPQKTAQENESKSDSPSLFFLKSSFRLRAKLRGRDRDFPYISCPHYMHSFSTVNSPHQSGAFVTLQPLTHRGHPKTTVYVRIHSWCRMGCAFGQVYNDVFPSLWQIPQCLRFLENSRADILVPLEKCLQSARVPLMRYFNPMWTLSEPLCEPGRGVIKIFQSFQCRILPDPPSKNCEVAGNVPFYTWICRSTKGQITYLTFAGRSQVGTEPHDWGPKPIFSQ